LIGITNERDPGTIGISGFSPASTFGTEITKSRPKSRRALPEIVSQLRRRDHAWSRG